jgi:hypothetical protein
MSCFLYVNDEESTGKVNIDELYENKKNRDLKQLSVFNKILNRIHTRIRMTGRNRRGDTHIWFNVPEYIFGETVYDKGDCIAYLVHKLHDNGFHVKYLHPNTLFVCWNHWVPQYVRSEFKKKTGKLMDEKGNITDPRKDEDDDGDGNGNRRGESDINEGLFNNGAPSAPRKDQKQYTPIDKYKPTGKFVYNPDLLEKIDKKVHF